jgi:hypothetical protein
MFVLPTSVGPLRRNYAHIRDLSSASQSNSVLMTSFFLLCHYTVSACLLQVYSIFTSFVVQHGMPALMYAAMSSTEIMQLLFKRGAAATINNKDKVFQFRFNLKF